MNDIKSQVEEDKNTLGDRASSPLPAQERYTSFADYFDKHPNETAVMITKPPTSEVTALAFHTVRLALQGDTDYAWSWQCNIAMAIYDESRATCLCDLDPNWDYRQHHKQECRVGKVYRMAVSPLTHEFCNEAAARFMKLCWDVDVKQSPQWASLFAKAS